MAISVLSATSGLISPAEAKKKGKGKVKELDRDELVEVAREMSRRQDVMNLMGEKWSERMQSGTATRYCRDDGSGCDTVIALDGSCRITREDDDDRSSGELRLSGNCVLIEAARHKLGKKNSLTAVGYAMPRDGRDNEDGGGRVVHYYEYKKPVDRIKTEAGRWEQDDVNEAIFRRTRSSHNGRSDKPVPRSQTRGTINTQQYEEDPCGGCSSECPLEDEYYYSEYVLDIDIDCINDPDRSQFCAACRFLREPRAVVLCGLVSCLIEDCIDCCSSSAACVSCCG